MKIKLTIILFFLMNGLVKAGGPMAPILAICEIQTVDSTFQGIIYLYKGGLSCICPNGIYISDKIDTTTSTGDFFYFSIYFRKFELFKTGNGADAIRFLYTKDLIKEKSNKSCYDTAYCKLEYYNNIFSFSDKYAPGMYFIDFLGNEQYHCTHNRIINRNSGRLIIPTEKTDDKYYLIQDSLSIYQELQMDSQMYFVVPSKASELKIPLNKIKSITIIKDPNSIWLEKIDNCGPEFYLRTRWFHKIVSSKKRIRKFLKSYSKYMYPIANHS